MKQRPLVTVASIGLVTVGACSIDQDFGQPVPSPVPVPMAEAGTEVPTDELVLSPPLLGPDYVHAMGGAHDGNGYLVVWHGQRGLVASRVATSGEVIDAVPFVLAPPTVAASLGVDPPRVFPRRGGGFRVLWNDLTPGGAFHHVTVDADGAAGRPITLPPLVAPVHASQRLTSMVALDDSGDAFRAVVEHGERAVVTNVAIGGVASACAAVVSLPGLVAGTTTFARAGERNLVGAIVQTPAGLAAVVAELSMPAQCATAPGLDTASEVAPSVELLRVPFAAATLSAMMTRPFELVTVDAGAVAVWADIVPKPIDSPIAISAALIPSRGGTAGTPLPLRSGLLRRHGGLGLGIAAHGDEVIVPFVGLLHDEPWWGYRLAAGSMTPTAIPGGATLAARGGPLFAIPGPHNDLLIGTGGGPWAHDSERPAAVAMLTRLTGDGPSPVAWPASPQLRSYVEANTPGVPPWEQDALPGSLASPRHARVS